MADGMFNIGRGVVGELMEDDNTKFGVMLLKAAEADDTLNNYDDLSALLGAAGNTEADFTNYARKTGLTATDSVDDANNNRTADLPDQTWSSAGGTTDNTLVKLIVFYDEGGTDATRIPIAHYDFAATTDGSDLTAQFNSAGFWQSG